MMRKTIMIMCMLPVLYTVGAVQKPSAAKPATKKTILTESELRTLAKSVPDVKNAGMLYSVAIATSNNVERKQEYLKVAAACLVTCDKKDVYTKYVKDKLLNAAEFEDELKDECKQCAGSGTKESRCYACKGNGQCASCKGTGQIKTVKYANRSLSKDYELKPCSKCNESGHCQRCNGEGVTKEKCLPCAGTGKAFSKTVAARIFRDLCNTIADDMNDAEASNNAKVDSAGKSDPEINDTEQQKVVTKDAVDKKTKEPESGKETGNDGQIVYTDGSVVTIPYGTIKLTRFELRGVDNIPQAHTSRGGGDGNDILKIVIPKSILSIGPNAFYNCENLKSVVIPDSVTNIGPCAFGRCKNLKNVMIPDSVVSIGQYAFQNCENLISVTIPNSVESIGRGAFKDCKNLKRARLPDQLRDIGDSLFLRCLTLESIVIPPGVTNIGSYAFSGCTSLKPVSIPDSVDSISDSAFDEMYHLEKSDKRRELDYFDDDCHYFVDGCYNHDSKGNFIYVENSSGRVNYLFEGNINIRPQAQFPDGRGGVRGAYYVSDIVFLGFPSPEARRLWSHAMHSGCKKMLEWVNTAKENKVGHVEKELPETAFKDGYAYACVDLVPSGSRQKELCYQAIRKGVDNGDVNTARRIEFKCVIDSSDNTKFNVKLLFGCGGEFPFVLYSCYRKTVDEIQTSARQFLQKVDPDTLARAWRSQVMRNSLFDDGIASNDVRNRLAVSKDDISAAKKSADYSRELYADFCLSSWYCVNSSHEGGRICLVIKDTEGDWNYTLFLGENGVAQRQIFQHGTYYGRDFIYDRHLIVFPTEESRNLWYDVMKRSCGKMLEWVELASKKHEPVVVKPTYVAGKGDSVKLVAYYNLITKGRGQDELLKKELRTHVNRSEYEQNGCPISLICNIIKKKGDPSYKKFKVWIDLNCGDKYQGTIFEGSGTYEDIQKECIKFLCKIDPNALIEAWKGKYGRGDLFK